MTNALTLSIDERRDPTIGLSREEAESLVSMLNSCDVVTVEGITFTVLGGYLRSNVFGQDSTLGALAKVARCGPGNVLPTLPEIIERLSVTDDDTWNAGPTYRSADGREHCVLSHIAEMYGIEAMDEFESIYASSYVIGRVNDGSDPHYRHDHPKHRVIAYLRALLAGKEPTTIESMADAVVGYGEALDANGTSLVLTKHDRQIATASSVDLAAIADGQARHLDTDLTEELRVRGYLCARNLTARISYVPSPSAVIWAREWLDVIAARAFDSCEEHIERRGRRFLLIVTRDGRRVCNIDAADLRKLSTPFKAGRRDLRELADHRTYDEMRARGWLIEVGSRGCFGRTYNPRQACIEWAAHWLREIERAEHGDGHSRE